MRRFVPAGLLILALLCAALAGPRAFGKLALLAGLPDLAGRLLTVPAERGIAQYRAGDYAAADASFQKTGRTATFNRADTLAALGQYDLALAYFDAVLFIAPEDDDARANRDYVASLVVPVVGDAVASKGNPATVSKEGSQPAAPETILDLFARRERSVLRPVDAQYTRASAEWLTTLADAPGEYLRKRLAAEYDRRVHLGLAVPQEADAW